MLACQKTHVFDPHLPIWSRGYKRYFLRPTT